MESRYTNRFRSLGDKTATQIKNQDAAGNLTERLVHAKGSISAQQENIKSLLMTATEMVKGVDTHQQMMGTELVKNIPLPTAEILQNHGKQLGYVQLTMRFMQAGMVHFMEEIYNAQGRIAELEKTIANLAEYDDEVELIGSIRTLNLDLLEDTTTTNNTPPSPPQSVTSDKPSVVSEVPIAAQTSVTSDISNEKARPSTPAIKRKVTTPMKK